jgi:hypothetical protein
MAGGGAVAAEPGAPAQWIPDDAVIAVEVFQPKALLAPFCDEKNASMITAMPAYQRQEARPEFKKFLAGVKFLENQLGADWNTALTKLTGGGLAFGLCPEQRAMLVADAEDEQMLNRLQELITRIAANRKDGPSQGGAAPQEIEGVNAWSLGPKEAHAIVGKRLVASGGVEGLRAALALRGKNGASSLAATPAYQAARQAVGADAIGMIFLNMEVLKQVPAIGMALKPHNDNPLAALLFAGIAETASSSKWLALGVHVREGGLALQLVSDGAKFDPKGPSAFALPDKAGEGAMPNITVPRQVAAVSFYRDLHRFYAAKDQLFPERTSGLVFFENMMGIFFSGRDLTDDVMAQTTPHLRLVVANPRYESAADTPAVHIPAFAAILELRNPEPCHEMIEEAWQKAVGLANVTRGQKAEPGLIIERPVHWTTKYTVARFSTANIRDKAQRDVHDNYRPSLAMPGRHLILSSTEDLACDLMDALGREDKQKVAPLAQTHSILELDGDKLAAAFLANREMLARQNILKSGGSGEANAGGIDWLIGVSSFVQHLRLSFGAQNGMSQALLDLNFKSPSGQKVAEAR